MSRRMLPANHDPEQRPLLQKRDANTRKIRHTKETPTPGRGDFDTGGPRQDPSFAADGQDQALPQDADLGREELGDVSFDAWDPDESGGELQDTFQSDMGQAPVMMEGGSDEDMTTLITDEELLVARDEEELHYNILAFFDDLDKARLKRRWLELREARKSEAMGGRM